MPNAILNAAYGPTAIVATGGTAPYTYAVTEGGLPPGITLSSSGLLSGTPTQVGAYVFRAEATDDAANSGSDTWVIYVSPPSSCDAVAGNLVQNCGFEADTEGAVEPEGWTRRPAPESANAVVEGSGDGPHTGLRYFSFGGTSANDDAIAQTLTGTTPGATYDVSFWLGDNFEPPEPHFSVTVEDAASGDVTLLDLAPEGSFYAEHIGTFEAGDGAPTLVISGRHDVGWLDVDDIVVTQKSPPPPPPPPVSPPVAAPAPTVTVTSSQSPSTVGDPVTFTARLTPAPSCGTLNWVIDNAAVGVGSGSGDTYTFGPISSLGVGTHQVVALFSGCFAMDAGSGAVNQVVLAPPPPGSNIVNPQITAVTTSAHPKQHGWYRSAVTVAFTCAEGSAALTAPCPAAVTLKRSGEGRQLTRTITASDGGTATVTVIVNIDREGPTVRVSAQLRCQATDELSGVASCRIHDRTRTRNGVTTTRWTAVAKDNAGNRTVKRGAFAVA